MRKTHSQSSGGTVEGGTRGGGAIIRVSRTSRALCWVVLAGVEVRFRQVGSREGRSQQGHLQSRGAEKRQESERDLHGHMVPPACIPGPTVPIPCLVSGSPGHRPRLRAIPSRGFSSDPQSPREEIGNHWGSVNCDSPLSHLCRV